MEVVLVSVLFWSFYFCELCVQSKMFLFKKEVDHYVVITSWCQLSYWQCSNWVVLRAVVNDVMITWFPHATPNIFFVMWYAVVCFCRHLIIHYNYHNVLSTSTIAQANNRRKRCNNHIIPACNKHNSKSPVAVLVLWYDFPSSVTVSISTVAQAKVENG